MNRLRLATATVITLFFISCQKDSPTNQPDSANSIRGKWEFKYVYTTIYKVSNNQVMERDTFYVPEQFPGSYFDFKTSEKMYGFIDDTNQIWDYKLLPDSKIEFIDYPNGGGKDTFDIVKLQPDILIMKDYNTNNSDPSIREENILYCEK